MLDHRFGEGDASRKAVRSLRQNGSVALSTRPLSNSASVSSRAESRRIRRKHEELAQAAASPAVALDPSHMAPEVDPAQESIVLASFESRHAAEQMLSSLGRGFRKQARKGQVSTRVSLSVGEACNGCSPGRAIPPILWA